MSSEGLGSAGGASETDIAIVGMALRLPGAANARQFWSNLEKGVESVRAFAGERWQEAVITPDEEHLLKDTWIGHYEALEITGPA